MAETDTPVEKRSKTARRVDYATWAMLIAGTAIAGYVFFFVGDLQRHVGEAHGDLASTTKQLDQVKVELSLQQTIAGQQSEQLASLNTTLQAMQTQLDATKASTQRACADLDATVKSLPPSEQPDDLTRLMKVRSDICPDIDKTLQDNIDNTRRTSLIAQALQFRLRGDFKDAAAVFQQALSAPGDDKQNRARTMTWYGYSLFRSGDIDDASKVTAQALQLDPGNRTAAVNSIKLICARKEPPAAALQAYRALLAEPGLSVSDICAVQNDTELYRICGYAQLSPRPAAKCTPSAG